MLLGGPPVGLAKTGANVRRGGDSNPRWTESPNRFSRPAHSTALPPLQGQDADKVRRLLGDSASGLAAPRRRTHRLGQRRPAKKAPSRSATPGEEGTQHVPGLFTQQTTLALRTVVELGDVEQVKHAAGGARLGIAGGKDDAWNP